jgi:hypothetical protein
MIRISPAGFVRRACALVLLACTALGGCIEEKCDPGYTSQRGACYPIPGDAGALGSADAQVEDGGAAQPAGCAPGEGFGVSCVDEADCSCGTQCIPVLKICSVLNCASTPEVCPEHWQCQGLSGSSPNPDVSSICLEEP